MSLGSCPGPQSSIGITARAASSARDKPNRTNRGWTSCWVGGATVHYSGFTYRLHPDDLKRRSILGEVSGATLADWPITWEDLLPCYERMEI